MSLWAVRWMPRSRSLTDRGDRPAASASSSCVSPASARSCRSNPANPQARLLRHRPTPLKPARGHRPGADRTHAPKPTQTRSPRHLPASASRGQQRIAGARHAGSARFADPPGLSQSAPGLATAAASGQASGFMWVFVWAVACGEPAGHW